MHHVTDESTVSIRVFRGNTEKVYTRTIHRLVVFEDTRSTGGTTRGHKLADWRPRDGNYDEGGARAPSPSLPK
ncbi:hypothetical protein B0H10DRAFT_1414228 [Mycena sp. CBHHK59/15]|nr:hypothetical protein B0H10DRAFT_1414228 [Mycena sp. CBHHK59/15]